MKVAIDTNVLFSGIYAPESVPGQILWLATQDRIRLYAPDTVRSEMVRVMVQKLCGQEEATRIVSGLPVMWIPRHEYEPFFPDAVSAIEDPDDAPLVAVALLAGADIVSGDGHFHPLNLPLVKTWRPRDLLTSLDP